MHRYLRAVGFRQESRADIRKLLSEIIEHPDHQGMTITEDGSLLSEVSKEFGDQIGITVAGHYDENEQFLQDYYYPYLIGSGVTTYEDITIERHAADDSYAGIVDDIRVGISMIFYLQNKIPYVQAQASGRLPVRGTTLTLSGLSVRGTILLPLAKDPEDVTRSRNKYSHHNKLMREARSGNEDAIEMLTMEDMNTYTEISRRILNEDVYTLVDTSVMPYGVECDQYTIVGEIVGIRMSNNSMTGEGVYLLTVNANELTFDVAINIIDLVGEPMIGRRFKGVVWLQGRVNFPEV